MGQLVRLGGGQIRPDLGPRRIQDPQHQKALVRAAADRDCPSACPAGALHGVIQGVSQQGAQIHILHRQLRRQGDGKIRLEPLPLHRLRLGAEHGVGRLVLTEAFGSPEDRGTGHLVQIADGILGLSGFQQPSDHGEMIAQIVSQRPHLLLLLPQALVIDLPQSGQLAGPLQPLMVCQDPHGSQQNDGGDQHEGQHNQPLVQSQGIDGGGLIFLKGQQYHGCQGTQRHGRQSQHDLPQPPGEAHLFRREPAAQQQPQRPEDQRPGQASRYVIQVVETIVVEALHIGVQQGADRHLQAEEDDAHRQPPHQVPFRTQEEEQEVHRQRVEQVGVPDPDHHAAAAGEGQKQQDLPAPALP